MLFELDDSQYNDVRQRLLKLVAEKAFQKGDFTLSSGKKSSYYIDLRKVTLDPQGLKWISFLFSNVISSAFPSVKYFGGLTLGADPLAVGLMCERFNQGLSGQAFVVRKESKSHGGKKLVEGLDSVPEGTPVVVLDDVITTGGSTCKAIESLKNEGFPSVGGLCVLDREEGGAKALEKMGVNKFFSLFSIEELMRL